MNLNPLNKLRRFSSAAKSAAPPMPAQAPPVLHKAQPVGSTPIEIHPAEINPEAKQCKNCKCGYTVKNFILYTKGPNITGWYCFECWAYYDKHKVLPTPTKRVIPVRAPRNA